MICFLNSFLIALFTFIYLIIFSLIQPLFGIESDGLNTLSHVAGFALSITLAVWTTKKVLPNVSRGQVCERGIRY